MAILGNGPWLVIRSEENLDRLRNSTRQRGLTSDALSRGVHAYLGCCHSNYLSEAYTQQTDLEFGLYRTAAKTSLNLLETA